MISLNFNNVKLKSKEVHFYYANIDEYLQNLDFFLRLLSEDEILRANKFKFLIDKFRFIVSRAILRIMSGYYLKIEARKVVFKYGEFGKPKYDMTTQIRFNISHSGSMMVLGFARDNEIGVDVEKIKTDFDVLEIAQNFFSNREVKSLLNLPIEQQHRAFYRCWTRKESFIKAKGIGLSFILDSFSISLDSDEEAELLETQWDSSEKDMWKIFS